MTKERRLAIQMWDEIRTYICYATRLTDIANIISRLKYRFMMEHNLDWFHGCWFCQYVRYTDRFHGEGCQRCPLSDGSEDAIQGCVSGCRNNAYARVLHAKRRKTKLEACDEIIRILKGALK